MVYDEITLEIRADGVSSFRIEARSMGRETAPFFPPQGLGEIDSALGLGPNQLRDIQLKQNIPLSPKGREVGTLLFRALLSERVLELYRRRIEAAKHRGRGLRLRIVIDTRDTRLTWLSRVPWELLYDPDSKEFLAPNPLRSIVRSLALPQEGELRPFRPPMRVLALFASPKAHPILDVNGERKALEGIFNASQTTEAIFVEAANRSRLGTLFQDAPFDVIHFSGHGAFDEASGSGKLLFQSDSGGEAFLSDEALRQLLGCTSLPRMVLLNACWSGQGAQEGNQDPFAGLAPLLSLAGVPAVIAMMRRIPDDKALRFSTNFYQCLLASQSIEASVASARLALFNHDPDSLDWATPALFLNVANGGLFKVLSEDLEHDSSTHPIIDLNIGTVRAKSSVNVTGQKRGPESCKNDATSTKISINSIESEGDTTIVGLEEKDC